ncbi:hypothetical protein UlMin_014528 [Ulmus minor]
MMGWGIPEQGWRKGPWTPEEDKLLSEYVNLHGEGRWSSVSRGAGLNRSGKSCRLRWVNYLRPGLKRGQITPQEEGIIIELHAIWGNKWSTIARYLPGRTDNEIKNYWRTHFKKKDKKPSQKQQKRKSQYLKQKLKEKEQQLTQEENIFKRSSSPHVESSEEKINIDEPPHQQRQQDKAFFAYPTSDQDHMMMSQDVSSWFDYYYAMADQDGLWGGLWNLDDNTNPNNRSLALQSQATANVCCGGDSNKASTIQNQASSRAAGFYCGGDYNNFYNKEYIF